MAHRHNMKIMTGKRSLILSFAAFIGLSLSACIIRDETKQTALGQTAFAQNSAGRNAVLLDNVATGSIRADAPLEFSAEAQPDAAAILAQFAALQDGARRKSGPWQNAETGSRGVVSVLGGSRINEAGETEICRRFQVTRESFDGIVLYRGEACKQSQNPWRLSYLKGN